MQMQFYHTKCKGTIDPKTRTCAGCNKKWSQHSFMFTNEIRPRVDKDSVAETGRQILQKGDTNYARWADKAPTIGYIASRLPNIPKWQRILIALTVVGLIITAFVFLVDAVGLWITFGIVLGSWIALILALPFVLRLRKIFKR